MTLPLVERPLQLHKRIWDLIPLSLSQKFFCNDSDPNSLMRKIQIHMNLTLSEWFMLFPQFNKLSLRAFMITLAKSSNLKISSKLYTLVACAIVFSGKFSYLRRFLFQGSQRIHLLFITYGKMCYVKVKVKALKVNWTCTSCKVAQLKQITACDHCGNWYSITFKYYLITSSLTKLLNTASITYLSDLIVQFKLWCYYVANTLDLTLQALG